MNLFLLIMLSVLPALLIVAYIYWLDRYEREPIRLIIICFLFGAFSTYPAIKMEEFGMYDLYITGSSDPLMTFTFAFLIIAFSEELVKYIFLRYYIFTGKEFNEPMDGIVYSVSISMGFAAMENVLHIVIRTEDFNEAVEIAYSRMLTAVPAHAAFAMTMGYFVGLAKMQPHRETFYLLSGLSGAVALHGLYDFFIFQEWSQPLTVYTFATLIGALIAGKYLTMKHVYGSPFKIKAHNSAKEKLIS
jgi:protease PrsW